MTYIAPYLTCEIKRYYGNIVWIWKNNQFTTVLWVYYCPYSSARMNQFYPSVHNQMYFDSNLNKIVIWFQFFFAGDMYQNLILSTSISWIVRVWMWWRSLWTKWSAKSRDFNDSNFRQGKARRRTRWSVGVHRYLPPESWQSTKMISERSVCHTTANRFATNI